jgi:FtsP/CotA-like multicopper oxidase with cupredoxin domain
MILRSEPIRIVLCAVFAVAAGACDAPPSREPPAPPSASAVTQPEGWDAELALPTVADLDPDPNVLEIELEAKIADVEILPGRPTAAWTYNGTVPGPLLRAKIGDRLIVHFKNSLPDATTIHWHGLRVPNDMDGAPGVTQAAIEPGAEFRYEVTLRDAGTYWYHPHSDSAAQVGRGLYGPIVVTDPQDPGSFGDELVLMLSDISLTETGELGPTDSGGSFGDLFGREGNVVLVNGKVVPRLKVRAGKQQRWRIINAARSRYFNLRLPEHRFMRLGGDNGLAARSTDVYNLIVTPGERADAVFTPAAAPGTTTILPWVPTERGYGSLFARAREDLLAIETVADSPVEPLPIPVKLREIEPIDTSTAVERTIDLTIGFGADKRVEMGMNGVPHWRAEPIEVRLGDTEVWNIVNDTDFAHPFHMHGYFFQVQDDARVPEWKDTVDVPAHSQRRIAIRFDERPGAWMYHCHILDHAERGMMGHLNVVEPGERPEPPVGGAHDAHAAHEPTG